RKNAVGLVQAFARVKQEGRIRERLVLIGGEKCEDPRLPDAIRSSGFEQDILLTNYIPTRDLAGLYSACTAFIYPSFYEGFGLPPLEAMACGAPVLVSDGGSLPEVAGDAARVFRAQDPGSMAQAIREVLLDPALQNSMIMRGKELVARYSWEKAARETLQMYTGALQSRREGIRAEQPLAPPPIRREREEIPAPAASAVTSPAYRIGVDSRLLGATALGTGRYTKELLQALLPLAKDAEFV